MNLATLGELIGVGSYDALEEAISESGEEHGAESGEAGLMSVPPELRDALADTDDHTDLAQKWAATEELRLARVTVEDASDLLRELAQLSRTAQAEARQLWFWWSL